LVRDAGDTPEYIRGCSTAGRSGDRAGVRSAAEARAVVAAAKYPPLGERGLSAACRTAVPHFPRAETLPALNDATLVIVQFESKAALERWRRSFALDGVDLC